MENVRLTDRKKSMLILTSMRSGSSFAGELFNQHPDVFYVFEPLYFLLGDAGYERKLRVLESIFTCNFTSFETLYDEANNISAQAFQKNIENCRKTKFCFRDKIKALTSKIGKIPDWAELSHRCQTAKLRVVKTLRIYKLSWLKRFFDDQRLDLRVLHLVRDPRAVFRSRSHIFNTNESMRATGHNCKMHSNIEYESRTLPGRVATVRYEDITANPLRFQERIYSYVGLEKHQDVIKWVKDNTNKSDNSTYGTSRMAEKQLGKWREDIDFSNVATVQDICSEMMTIFNYKRLQSEPEMRDLNVNIYPT
uniref:Uncharacterized protein n=1 Tax=Ciona savignyi TaxID=51511 RepID=H2YZ85_CIOSA